MSEFLNELSNVLETEHKNFAFIGPGDIGRISSILGQNDYHNIVYVGKSGVGKTANLLGLVQAQNQSPESSDISLPLHMINRKFYMLDISSLFTGDDAQIRANIQSMFATLKRPGDHTLVIEDANDFLAAIDDHNIPGVVSMFMSELREGTLQCIWMVREVAGANTKLLDVLECHSDMEEMFTVLRKEPPENDEVFEIIDSRRCIIEQHHDGLTVPAVSAKEVAELTMAYPSLSIYQREQPARAIRMMDHIASTFLTNSTQEKNDDPTFVAAVQRLQVLDAELNEAELVLSKAEESLRQETETLKNDLRVELGTEPGRLDINAHKNAEMKEHELTIVTARRVIENSILPKIVKIKEEVNVSLELDLSTVRALFSEISGIPSNDLSDNEAEKALQIEERMLQRIFGQDHAVQTVTGAIKRAKAGLKDPNKPIGGFIMLGSSGVGKSFLGEILAETLFNDPDNMTTFDMSEFMEKHTVSKLIGAPPGYAGYGSGGALTNAVREHPHQVILLDEIEKAHPDVFKILLQVFDKGRLSDELGTVDFSNVILLLTTNLAQHLSFEDDIDASDPVTRDRIIGELLTIFPQELINRVDDFILFKALLTEHIEKIVTRKINKINSTLAQRTKITVELDDENVRELVKGKYKQEEGSRQVLMFIGNHLERKIADIVLRHPEGGNIKAIFNGTNFDLNFEAN